LGKKKTLDSSTKNARLASNEAKTKANKERRAAKHERKLQQRRDKRAAGTTTNKNGDKQ